MAKKPVMIGNEIMNINKQGTVTKPPKAVKSLMPVYVPTSEDLDQIVAEFHQLTSNMYEIPPAKPNEEHYRQVLVPGWPKKIHYEFITRKNSTNGHKAGISLEFHYEKGDFKHLAELIQKIPQTIGAIDNNTIYCGVFYNKPSLEVHLPAVTKPYEIAVLMLELINKTKDSISAAISGVR